MHAGADTGNCAMRAALPSPPAPPRGHPLPVEALQDLLGGLLREREALRVGRAPAELERNRRAIDRAQWELSRALRSVGSANRGGTIIGQNARLVGSTPSSFGRLFGEWRAGWFAMEADAGRADVQEKAGKAQTLFREVNERMAEFLAPQTADEMVTILCECADDACIEPVEIAKADYESVRDRPARFIVRPGHGVPEAERVVARNDGVMIVEKFGAAAEVAYERYRRGGELTAG